MDLGLGFCEADLGSGIGGGGNFAQKWLKTMFFVLAYCSFHRRWHRILIVAPHRNMWKHVTECSVVYLQPHNKGADHLFRREGQSMQLCKWQRAMSHNVGHGQIYAHFKTASTALLGGCYELLI